MEGWPFGLAGAGLAWLNMHATIAFWVKSSIAKPICVLCAGTYLFEGFAALGAWRSPGAFVFGAGVPVPTVI